MHGAIRFDKLNERLDTTLAPCREQSKGMPS